MRRFFTQNTTGIMYEIGVGKADITAFKLGVGMMGYGMYFNIVKGVETDLFARAVVIRDTATGKKVALVNAEICFITIAIRRGVMKKLKRKHEHLGFTEDSVMITAQHTHSAPGGYSHFGLYNMTIPGFVPEVYQKVVDGIVEAIVEAAESIRPATIKISKSEVGADKEVAFNRSLDAYNANPEIKTKLKKEEANQALDRSMLLMRFDDLEGNPIGSWNWFGVHTTSLSNDNHRICSDNKGYASKYHEDKVRKRKKDTFISVFAQRKTGDVTPNWKWDRKKKWTRGKFEDDFESAKYNGEIQFEHAHQLFKQAKSQEGIPTRLDYVMTYVDFRKVIVAKEFACGQENPRTGPACHGVSFFEGTVEGPGMAPAVGALARTLIRAQKVYDLAAAPFKTKEKADRIYEKYHTQGPKDILIEADDRRILGSRDIKNLVVPGWADPAIGQFKRFHANGSLGDKPWIQQILPIQIIILGNLALAGIPAEITTIAGKRLEDTLLEVLADRGVTEVICSTYSNAYCGYITTFEEYQLQLYEGGHTVFGQHFLGAIQTKFKQLAMEMLKPESERSVVEDGNPTTFTEEELELRSFDIKTQKRLIQL
ncbi:MAG: neutral/alkaline non-lysosomal ceramidase N-terminal domain-containing protein [Flavobacteriales bacterium]|nr:neutral/alkaline non-lysosomal ceramidase N-terminal domain-containing protein [Flavobacteriales bacterium]